MQHRNKIVDNLDVLWCNDASLNSLLSQTIMKTLNHATGRNYGKPQCLRITVLDCVADDFGLFDVSARFVDDARGISGCVSVLTTSERDIGAAVQAAYDAGDYLTA